MSTTLCLDSARQLTGAQAIADVDCRVLATVLARAAQRDLDRAVGAAMGLSSREVEERRRALLERIRDRLTHAAAIRAAGSARGGVIHDGR